MPVQVIWDDEAKTIIRQIYIGMVTVQNYIEAIDEVEMLANSVDYTCHSIMDRRQIAVTPGLILSVLSYAREHTPPNLGLRVVVRGSKFTQIAAEVGRRIAPNFFRNIFYVDTLEEAYVVIKRYQEDRRG